MGRQIIGTRAEAMAIVKALRGGARGRRDNDLLHALQSIGWDFLGEGCYREAWKSPSGVVYKVQLSDGAWDSSNEDEVRRARALRLRKDIPEDIVIPKASGFRIDGRTVVAMEFMDGEQPPGCWWSSWDNTPQCECGEASSQVYNAAGGTVAMNFEKDACRYMKAILHIRKALRSSDVHNGNYIELPDNRWAVIDLQM